MSSVIGLCIPRDCKDDKILEMVGQFYKHQAILAGFKEEGLVAKSEIQRHYVTVDQLIENPTIPLFFFGVFLLLLLAVMGTLVETTAFGNRTDVAVDLIEPLEQEKDLNRLLLF